MPRRLLANNLTIIIALVAFISIGLPDAVLGVAWPTMRDSFGRDLEDLGAILFSSGGGYIASGLISGWAIPRLGTGRLLILSTGLVTTGLLGYAVSPAFPVLLCLAVLIGLGSGAVDSALNVFAAENFSNRVMNLLHAFFGFGAMIGPIVMASVLSSGITWRWGYVIVGTATLAMTVAFVIYRDAWNQGQREQAAREPSAPLSVVVRHPLVWLQVVVFIFTTGVEFTVGAWAYTVLVERLDVGTALAGLCVGGYWGAMTLGRLVLGGLSRSIGDRRLILGGAFGMLLASLLFNVANAPVAIAGMLLFGLSQGPLFPTLMSLTPARLGSRLAVHAIGFQVSAAVLGGSVIPTIAGILSARLGLGAIGATVTVGVAVLIVLLSLLHVRTNAPEPGTASTAAPA